MYIGNLQMLLEIELLKNNNNKTNNKNKTKSKKENQNCIKSGLSQFLFLQQEM